jgi:solute carrier family 25 phosphate transporter 3
MASRQSLLPSFLYAPSRSGGAGAPDGMGASSVVVAASPNEPPFGKMEMFSPAYYAACGVGGAAACGLTHAAVTPLDVIKCNIQVRRAGTLPRCSAPCW